MTFQPFSLANVLKTEISTHFDVGRSRCTERMKLGAIYLVLPALCLDVDFLQTRLVARDDSINTGIA